MKIFWMFPGQGSQKPGMARDWYENFQESKLAFEEASDGCSLNLKKIIFEGTDSDLKSTEITQPAILTASIAILSGLAQIGPRFSESIVDGEALFGGHSLGEYTALVAMGVLDLGSAAGIVCERGRFMQEAVPPGKGSMAALMFRPKTESTSEKSLEICEKISSLGDSYKIWVANFNSNEQIVVSGMKKGIDTLLSTVAEFSDLGLRKAIELPVSAPFHCPMMKPAAEKLKPHLVSAKWKLPAQNLSYVANVDAKIHEFNSETNFSLVADRLEKQIVAPVLWVDSIKAAHSMGCQEFVEIGPGTVLSGLSRKILGEASVQIENIEGLDTYRKSAEERGIST